MRMTDTPKDHLELGINVIWVHSKVMSMDRLDTVVGIFFFLKINLGKIKKKKS